MTPPSQQLSESRRKAMLFCATCGHESRVDGDWIVRDGDDGEVYECPACGETLTVRGRFAITC